MKWRYATPGQWAGVLILLLGLSMSVIGVVSPWWRVMEGQHCSQFEGLWQQCLQCPHHASRCHFSERTAGLWRAIQALKLVSLVSLTGALLCSVYCAHKKNCSEGKCPTPSVAAFTGGFLGLAADLMYVGHIERYVQHVPYEHMYAWSFAMSVAGSAISLLASLVLSMANALCGPRYTSHVVEPYLSYKHYQVGVDADGYPLYIPYHVPTPHHPDKAAKGPDTGTALTSTDVKQQLFFQYGNKDVQVDGGGETVQNGHVWPRPNGDIVRSADLAGERRVPGQDGADLGLSPSRTQQSDGKDVLPPGVEDSASQSDSLGRKSLAMGCRQDTFSSQQELLSMEAGNPQDPVAREKPASSPNGRSPTNRQQLPWNAAPDGTGCLPQTRVGQQHGSVFTIEKAMSDSRALHVPCCMGTDVQQADGAQKTVAGTVYLPDAVRAERHVRGLAWVRKATKKVVIKHHKGALDL